MNNILSASILSADFAHLANEISACEDAGVDWIHVDVMDGHFVQNLTMGPFIVETCRKITTLPLDCHLMIENPETLIEAFAHAGATNITIHPERNPLIRDTLIKIKSLGCRAGIAINPSTPAEMIKPLLEYADLILVMTVNPGYSGQLFMPEMIGKIAEVSVMIQSGPKPPFLEVDGGINVDTIKRTQIAGANAFVSASAIFHYSKGIAAGVNALRKVLN
jgi:ribulose-phosphate 3-epimerase